MDKGKRNIISGKLFAITENVKQDKYVLEMKYCKSTTKLVYKVRIIPFVEW